MDEAHRKVREVISADRWDWSNISFDLPQDIKKDIQATPYVVAARTEDRVAWAYSHNGDFDLKSAYELVVGLDNLHPFKGQWIWKAKIPPHIQFFLWKCYHNSIKVRSCLASQGINIVDLCPLCHQTSETIIHAL